MMMKESVSAARSKSTQERISLRVFLLWGVLFLYIYCVDLPMRYKVRIAREPSDETLITGLLATYDYVRDDLTIA